MVRFTDGTVIDISSDSKGSGLYVESRDTTRNKFALVDVAGEIAESNLAVNASTGRDAPYSSSEVENMKMGTPLYKLARAGKIGMRSTLSGVVPSPHILNAKRAQEYTTNEWKDFITDALVLDMWSQIISTGVAMDPLIDRYNMQNSAFGYYRGFVPVHTESRMAPGKMACITLPEDGQGTMLVLKEPSGTEFIEGDEHLISNRQQMAKTYVKMLSHNKKDYISPQETQSDMGLQVLCYKLRAILEIYAAKSKSPNVFTKDSLKDIKESIDAQMKLDDNMYSDNKYWDDNDDDDDEDMGYGYVNDDIEGGEDQLKEILKTGDGDYSKKKERKDFESTFHKFLNGGYLLTVNEAGEKTDTQYSLSVLRKQNEKDDDWFNESEYYIGSAKYTPYRYMENARNSLAAGYRMINAHFRKTIVGYTASGVNGNGMLTLSITQ